MRIELRDYPSYGSIKQYNQYGIPDATIPVTPGVLYSFGAWFKSCLLYTSPSPRD